MNLLKKWPGEPCGASARFRGAHGEEARKRR